MKRCSEAIGPTSITFHGSSSQPKFLPLAVCGGSLIVNLPEAL